MSYILVYISNLFLQAYIKLKEKEIKVGKGKKEDHGRSGNITMCEIAAETFLVPMDNKIRNEIVSREIKEVWNKCERER